MLRRFAALLTALEDKLMKDMLRFPNKTSSIVESAADTTAQRRY